MAKDGSGFKLKTFLGNDTKIVQLAFETRILRKFQGLVAKLSNGSVFPPGRAIGDETGISILELDVYVRIAKPTHVHQQYYAASQKTLTNTINGICMGWVNPAKFGIITTRKIP